MNPASRAFLPSAYASLSISVAPRISASCVVQLLATAESRSSGSSLSPLVLSLCQRSVQALSPTLSRLNAENPVKKLNLTECKQMGLVQSTKASKQYYFSGSAPWSEPMGARLPLPLVHLICDYLKSELNDLYTSPIDNFWFTQARLVLLLAGFSEEHYSVLELARRMLPACQWNEDCIPENAHTFELYEKIIPAGWPLKLLPIELRNNPVLCLLAIKQDAESWGFISKNLSDDLSFRLAAVNVNGLVLAFMMLSFKPNFQLCQLAVRQNSQAIDYVPPAFIARNNALLTAAAHANAIVIANPKPGSRLDASPLITKTQRTQILKVCHEKFKQLDDLIDLKPAKFKRHCIVQ